MSKNIIRTSKFLSLVLRHAPEKIGLNLDDQGWANVRDLLESAKENGKIISLELLNEVVVTNDKQRFVFSDDGLRIRANQGHSVKIELGLDPVEPPETLFHGTATRFLDSIKEKGLVKGSRQHVHLSDNEMTALKVGQRHGKPVILKVNASKMYFEGFKFYLSKNEVWLTDFVPENYIVL